MPSLPGDTTALPPAAVSTQPRRPLDARLIVVHPPELAAETALASAEVVLGRATQGGFSMPHPTLSRRHLAFRWEGGAGRRTACDLGSKNGSSIDGEPLRAAPRVLHHGAVIRAGGVLIVYEEGGEPDGPTELAAAIPGTASATRALRALIAQAAPDPAHILLTGETGTGKEHVARALHDLSGRPGPFLAVSCAELTGELMAGQLFGHARGAFTGAHQAQSGLFRAASGGTLLLDEIGELAPALQPKLLRVLQERCVLPVGEQRPIPVDVRVVAATNADIAALVDSGAFRRDLHARLAFWDILVPPLRSRRADILAWVGLLHRTYIERRPGGGPPLVFDADAAEAILRAPWPDNLRGLDRLVHRLAASSPRGALGRDAVASLLAAPEPSPPARPDPPGREELEARLAELGSVAALARHYGRNRRQIYRWLKARGVR